MLHHAALVCDSVQKCRLRALRCKANAIRNESATLQSPISRSCQKQSHAKCVHKASVQLLHNCADCQLEAAHVHACTVPIAHLRASCTCCRVIAQSSTWRARHLTGASNASCNKTLFCSRSARHLLRRPGVLTLLRVAGPKICPTLSLLRLCSYADASCNDKDSAHKALKLQRLLTQHQERNQRRPHWNCSEDNLHDKHFLRTRIGL
jgi:hypothetical protein